MNTAYYISIKDNEVVKQCVAFGYRKAISYVEEWATYYKGYVQKLAKYGGLIRIGDVYFSYTIEEITVV